MKILIAEDDPVAQKVLQYTLQHLGHEVRVTANGAAAWEQFDREPVRVIVSDWMMDTMDGLELCRKIRAREKTDYTYFILLTAINPDKENYAKAIDAGIDDFLTKPLDRANISMRLRVAERILGFTTQIRQLKELLPICMYCNNIRDDDDSWHKLEHYIHEHAGSDFTHGICPVCYAEQMAELQRQRG